MGLQRKMYNLSVSKIERVREDSGYDPNWLVLAAGAAALALAIGGTAATADTRAEHQSVSVENQQ